MKNVNVKEINVVSTISSEIELDKDFASFEKALACIDSSEKSLLRLEKELYNIVIKCSVEFIHRNKLVMVAKVFDRLERNERTKKAYGSKFLKAFNILTGGFIRDDKGSYFYSKNLSTTVYLKKEKIFLERIDIDTQTIKNRLGKCKDLVNSEYFATFQDLYSLKNEVVETDFAGNFLKSLITLVFFQSN